MSKIKIDVTANDIDAGKPGFCYACPVAIAISRKLNTKTGVNSRWAWAGNDMFRLPTDVCLKVMDYDRSGVMHPFSFELKVNLPEVINE